MTDDAADLRGRLAAAEERARNLADEVDHLLSELADFERQNYHLQLELDAHRP